MDDEHEEIEFIYHGTSLTAAQTIFSQKKLVEKETWFTEDRKLAWYFADRSCRKSSRAERRALLVLQVYLEDLRNWRQGRLVFKEQFDEGDAPELHGKTQLKFSSEAVRLLNHYALEWKVDCESANSQTRRL